MDHSGNIVYPVGQKLGAGRSSIVKRSIDMRVANRSKYAWESPRVYFASGTANAGLPSKVESGQVMGFGAHNSYGLLPAGSAGVLTYYVPSQGVTVALMWSVPFFYGLASNLWNVAILKGEQPACAALFCKLRTSPSSPLCKGDANPYSGSHIDGDWTYEGSMGHSSTPALDVAIFYA